MFSRLIARERLHILEQIVGQSETLNEFKVRLEALPIRGLALIPAAPTQRIGVVSLDDARKVADDFLILCTTRQAQREFFLAFDFRGSLGAAASVDYLDGTQELIIVRAAYVEQGAGDALLIYDGDKRKRLELEVDCAQSFAKRAGWEYPVGGLRAIRTWEPVAQGRLQEHHLGGIPIRPIPLSSGRPSTAAPETSLDSS
jgi:hypothetical protein